MSASSIARCIVIGTPFVMLPWLNVHVRLREAGGCAAMPTPARQSHSSMPPQEVPGRRHPLPEVGGRFLCSDHPHLHPALALALQTGPGPPTREESRSTVGQGSSSLRKNACSAA